jgi:CheY-like chemotaxis protein
MNILAVDDKPINNNVIELDLEEYFEDRDLEFEFTSTDGGEKAIELIKSNNFDIIFMDYMMPGMDGIETISHIRAMGSDIKQPHIVMVTALNTTESIASAKEAGADLYIAKPYCNKEIADAIEAFRAKGTTSNEPLKEEFIVEPSDLDGDDDFIDFDDDFGDEFMDFDDEDSEIEDHKGMMNEFNKSHKQIPASEFLLDYPDIDEQVEELEFIEGAVYEHIDTLNENNLSSELVYVLDTLDQYSRFFNIFTEFQELSTAMTLLMRVLNNTEFYMLDPKHKKFIAEYLIAILNDLVEWKNHVFVDQDAIDVFYINASLLNSCIQLEAMIKNLNK